MCHLVILTNFVRSCRLLVLDHCSCLPIVLALQSLLAIVLSLSRSFLAALSPAFFPFVLFTVLSLSSPPPPPKAPSPTTFLLSIILTLIILSPIVTSIVILPDHSSRGRNDGEPFFPSSHPFPPSNINLTHHPPHLTSSQYTQHTNQSIPSQAFPHHPTTSKSINS